MSNPLEQIPIPLLSWYEQNARELPWREEKSNPYRVWVSEIMLQQTRVTAVLGYFTRFMSEYPEIKDLANAEEESLMKVWQGLGYYSRARNLHKAAKQIMEEHGGIFPREYKEIHALSGIGDYTASAISSICYGEPYPAVDGNLLRVVARLTADDEDITSISMKKKVTNLLSEIMPLQASGKFNQALMDLGAMICLPNGIPLCARCPLSEFCQAFEQDKAAELPYRSPKKARKVEDKDIYLIVRDDMVALRQREKKGLLAGLWEYPSELACMENEETTYLGNAKHIFTHIEWHMRIFLVYWHRDTCPSNWVWVNKEELIEKYPIPTAFSQVTKMYIDLN